MLKAALTSLAAIALMTGPAAAQTRGAPIVKGVTTGDLSQQVDQTRQQTADLLLQLSRNADDIRTLNGRIEALEFELSRVREASSQQTLDNETLAEQNAALRQQVEAQGRAIAAIQMVLGIEAEVPQLPGLESGDFDGNGPALAETGPALPPAGTPQSRAGGPSVLTPSQQASSAEGLPEGSLGTISASQLPGAAGPLFTLARQRLLALDYAGAEEAFRAFVEEFGDDPQAGEAYFWLGESLHQQQAYAESGAAYTTMIRSFPDDQRAPDALARLARSMRLIGETERACQALDTLPKRYPNASKVVRDLAAVERTRSGCTG